MGDKDGREATGDPSDVRQEPAPRSGAQSLGVHANTVRNLVRRGQLRTLPGLRSIRITTASLHSYVATPAAR